MAHPAELLEQALEHHRAGRLEQAEFGYRDVLSRSPDHADALHLLGVVYHQRDEHARAVESIRSAIQVNHSCAPFHSNLGVALRSLGRLEEAVDCYREAARLAPAWGAPYYNLANACRDLGRLEEAVDGYRSAIERDPQNADAYNNLGDVFKQAGRLGEAIECHSRAISLRPNFAEAWFNLGNALKRAGRTDEAVDAYRKALEFRPTYADALVNLGCCLEEQGNLADATASYEQAIEFDPNSADARFNRALALLKAGDFARGWSDYGFRPAQRLSQDRQTRPAWDGNPAPSRTVLVRGEQGIGDEIMFASCLPDLLPRVAGCIFECHPRLVPLFQRSFPAAHVRGRSIEISAAEAANRERHSQAPDADVEIALGSLPKYLRRTAQDFPPRDAYLVPSPQALTKWRSRYAGLGDGLKVGISWRGGNDESVRAARSTTLDLWSDLLSVPSTRFVSLQYGATKDELDLARETCNVTVHDWDDSDPLRDLDDFAARIAALDLVVSVDNSTVHVSGALGVPTWGLLPFAADWRWLLDRSDSPWYRSVRLFRQPRPGDWATTFARAAEELKKQAGASVDGTRPAGRRAASA